MHTESMEPDTVHGHRDLAYPQSQTHNRVMARKFPTIVLAEDDNALRDMLSEVLHKDGCEVVQAWDGASLLDYVRYCEKRRQQPDLLITDLHMPKYSGLHILQRLQLLGWNIPIIVITAFGEECALDHGWKLGVADVFHKPFDTAMLRATIHACLRQCHHPIRHVGKRAYAI